MTRDSMNVSLIRKWCEATTNGDVATVRRLVTTDVEFVGPRGTGVGADIVVDWVERSGIHIEPLLMTDPGAQVVAECTATWPEPDVGVAATRTMPVATTLTFDIRDHRIAAIRRSDEPGTN